MALVRNLSVRVPWHDLEWNGHVCSDPLRNSACLAIKLIAERRDDAQEAELAGESFENLGPTQLPPCMRTSGAFLSPSPHAFESVMSYSRWSVDHKHIQPRLIHLPAWGALTIPYRWMLKESGFAVAQELGLECGPEQEPDQPDWLEKTSWVQGFENQAALLNAFAEPLVEGTSLVLFYATRTPLVDSERRVLLGAAVLSKKHGLEEYPYNRDTKPGAIRSMVWERPVQHTLRKLRDGSFEGGFVMPYHALEKHLEEHVELDPANFIAFAPDDARAQFSYGSEHVSHGVAAAALVSARNALERIAKELQGPWERYIDWIDGQLSSLWKMQGPAPGLGPVLSALHPGFNGTLFAMALADELPGNADPWPVVGEIMGGARPVPAGAPAVTKMLRNRWKLQLGEPGRLDAMKLLARMELTREQAARALQSDTPQVLRNPYVLFEGDRHSPDPIAFATVDRGIFPGAEVATAHPLPASCDPDLAEYDNEFRLRAACVEILERSCDKGHTLLPVGELPEAASDLHAVQAIPLDADTVEICRESFKDQLTVHGKGKDAAVQLARYLAIGALISEAIQSRIQAERKAAEINWRARIDDAFGALQAHDADEVNARAEKADALCKIAESRFSVLIGPAGTGKTTVIKFLLEREDIVGRRVRLLAPTGKARVRLGKETGRPDGVQTVAQFLLDGRYDSDTGRYYTNDEAPKLEATTCIVDESSMLTEDMLAAIVDALPTSCRLILVGDPYQLPPIGAGCPFVDIIEYLQRHRDGVGVAQLRTPRRTREQSGDSILGRADVQLAAIFSGRELPPGEDEIVANAITGKDAETLKFRQFSSTADLPQLVESVLQEEFQCGREELVDRLELSMGARKNDKGFINFEPGASACAADWQILSLNRNGPVGSLFLNRRIKEGMRAKRLSDTLASARTPHYKKWWRFPKPRGPENIVYGDKVICVRNHQRGSWIYDAKSQAPRELLANGEIGIVTGQRTWGHKAPSFTHVEFENRGDRSFSFSRGDFSEDGEPKLELAYAITVHKAQGSEFETVILVLPARSRLISREMLYTALTRQSRRVWVLHQGPFENFLSIRQYAFSDIASRYTNLLTTFDFRVAPALAELPAALRGSTRTFLAEKLIHRTIRGEMVSSKNEVVIANILHALETEGRLRYRVEPQLPFDDGRGRWADFQIDANGQTWYWEHCGRMDDANYRARWARKLKLYESNGYTRFSPANAGGRLIVTEDGSGKGLDSAAIDRLARGLFAA